ncbi:MAG: ATP-binding protein [Rubrivivax sp.]
MLQLPAPPTSQAEVDHLAARLLVVLMMAVGTLVLVAGTLPSWLGTASPLTRLRLALGVWLLASGALAAALRRRRPRLASMTVIVATAMASWINMFGTGAGVHGLVLGGVLFAIGLSGVLVSLRLALALAVMHVLMVLLAYQAERSGLIAGAASLPAFSAVDRVVGQLVLTSVSLAAAVLLARLIQGGMARAFEREAQLAELLSIGSDWTWEMSAQGLMTSISASFEARTGRTVAEFMRGGQPGGPQPEDDDEWREVQALMKARQPYRDRIITFRCADGTRLAVMASGSPRHDEQGRFTGWRGVSRNVTPERLAQQAQARTRTLLDRLVQMSPDAICVARLGDGAILLANPEFLRLAGRSESDVLGRSAVQLGLWRDLTPALQLRDALAADGQVRDLRVMVRLFDGSEHPMLLSAAAFQWDGEPVAVITTRDVAEIERARAEADAASRAKSAFLATMSHEIRTPLNGVLGLARLAQDPQLDETRRLQYLQHLQDAAELLSGIVSDVLDLSKIEAGHLQMETIGFDLHEVVRRSFGTFEPLGRERGLALHCQIAPEVPRRVLGDPVRVRQILANYLGNALKFTQRGEIALSLQAAGDSPLSAGGLAPVRIEVRDTGPGIGDAVRAQLFRPFAQGDSSTTRRFGGTGLGLSICRELAERMGGRVGVDSDGVSGSTFWVELMLPPEPRAAAPAQMPDGATQPLQGLQVLVAEDNAVNRLIVGVMLRQLGADVHEADDGEQAVALAARLDGRLHVVLMDLHMPVLDGLQAARALRARLGPERLPIYALSAAVLDAERHAAGEAGMNGFISKPVLREELLRVLLPWVPAGR